MTAELTAEKAIEEYQELCLRYPGLVCRPKGFPYRIVHDPREMLAFCKEHDLVLGVHSETAYTFFVVDLVEKDDPRGGGPLRFPYQRLLLRRQLEGAPGVVVVAVNADPAQGEIGGLFLVPQSRHATGATHLEVVRGFGEPASSAEENARRELLEEAGLVAGSCVVTGTLLTDPGLTDAEVTVVVAHIVARVSAKPEANEATGTAQLWGKAELRRAVCDGRIRDALTIAAVARFLWSISSA